MCVDANAKCKCKCESYFHRLCQPYRHHTTCQNQEHLAVEKVAEGIRNGTIEWSAEAALAAREKNLEKVKLEVAMEKALGLRQPLQSQTSNLDSNALADNNNSSSSSSSSNNNNLIRSPSHRTSPRGMSPKSMRSSRDRDTLTGASDSEASSSNNISRQTTGGSSSHLEVEMVVLDDRPTHTRRPTAHRGSTNAGAGGQNTTAAAAAGVSTATATATATANGGPTGTGTASRPGPRQLNKGTTAAGSGSGGSGDTRQQHRPQQQPQPQQHVETKSGRPKLASLVKPDTNTNANANANTKSNGNSDSDSEDHATTTVVPPAAIDPAININRDNSNDDSNSCQPGVPVDYYDDEPMIGNQGRRNFSMEPRKAYWWNCNQPVVLPPLADAQRMFRRWKKRRQLFIDAKANRLQDRLEDAIQRGHDAIGVIAETLQITEHEAEQMLNEAGHYSGGIMNCEEFVDIYLRERVAPPPKFDRGKVYHDDSPSVLYWIVLYCIVYCIVLYRLVYMAQTKSETRNAIFVS